MSTSDTFNRVVEIIRENFSGLVDYKFTSETHFSRDLQFDSLDEVELIVSIEEAFKIEIPDIEAEEIKTVGQAAAKVDELLAAKLKAAAR